MNRAQNLGFHRIAAKKGPLSLKSMFLRRSTPRERPSCRVPGLTFGSSALRRRYPLKICPSTQALETFAVDVQGNGKNSLAPARCSRPRRLPPGTKGVLLATGWRGGIST